MSNRHCTPHSLQFAKLLCWGTLGTLCLRLHTKILVDFHCCPFSGEEVTHVHPFYPFFIQTSTYGIGKAPRMLLWKGTCLRNCNPVSLKSNALDAGLLAARFGLGGIVANWNLLNKTLTKSGSFLATSPFGVWSYSAKAKFQTCLFTLKDSTHR